AACSMEIVTVPRLPISRLLQLRSLVDHLVSYRPEEESPGGFGDEKAVSYAMDLFLPLTQPNDMSGAERQKAVALLRALLMEVVTKPANEPAANGKKGADDE